MHNKKLNLTLLYAHNSIQCDARLYCSGIFPTEKLYCIFHIDLLTFLSDSKEGKYNVEHDH